MSIPTKITISPDNDTVLSLGGFNDILTKAFQNNVVGMVATLYDQNGNIVAGVNAIPMAYLATTNGNYQGVIPGGTLGIVEAAPGLLEGPVGGYKLVITASVAGVKFTLTIAAQIAPRGQ